MKKLIIIFLPLLFIAILSGYSIFKSKNPNVQPNVSNMLTENEARNIAESTCINKDESLNPGYYNEITKTWWFDANLTEIKEGCNPACVVSEDTKTAEINWRCTGLIKPKISTAETLQQLFIEKYPKYAETLIVNIKQETENHIRGDVIFKTGAPGGYFFAAKIDSAWQIVFEGNGEITCDLSKYGFPDEMLEDCAK